MLNALTYVTRRCPRNCNYCALRDAKDVGEELTEKQWKKAFLILHKMGIDFNLILGNETWLLEDKLVNIMQKNKVPYALYTTCPEPLFSRNREKMFSVVDNLSCGVDWSHSFLAKKLHTEDSEKKSWDAWNGFHWAKKNYPGIDCQGTITVHKNNLTQVPSIVRELTDMGIFAGINFIHWNSDGNFDFFPEREEIERLVFPDTDEMHAMVRRVLNIVLREPGLLQNPEMLKVDTKILLNMGWHCKGNPYGGPTIDADGTLRLCGYRKGTYTPKFTIFDLPEHWAEWRKAVKRDAMECPGCSWSYPWMYHYWKNKDKDMGTNVFIKHAGNHIEKEKWSKRKQEVMK